MTETAPDPVNALRLQGMACARMGSPMNARLLELAAEDWLGGGAVREVMAPWNAQPLNALLDAAVPLRLVASWRELALSGDEPSVAEAYGRLDAEAIWT